ncbi:regulatory protein RecX [Shewanella sp. YIC-542]|uniref:regulatory protein RecX n=1 Tax=Shewanella mytili TaxID=3377111 RepID=UPI00398EC3ED
MTLLARRDYSRGQLCARLLDKGFAKLDIAPLLDALEQQGVVDDQRYAAMLIRGQIAKGHGPVRIRQTALQKGLTKETVEMALAAADCDWVQLAKARALKKFGADNKGVDAKERARRMRHLSGQGFNYEQIAAALDDDPEA